MNNQQIRNIRSEASSIEDICKRVLEKRENNEVEADYELSNLKFHVKSAFAFLGEGVK